MNGDKNVDQLELQNQLLNYFSAIVLHCNVFPWHILIMHPVCLIRWNIWILHTLCFNWSSLFSKMTGDIFRTLAKSKTSNNATCCAEKSANISKKHTHSHCFSAIANEQTEKVNEVKAQKIERRMKCVLSHTVYEQCYCDLGIYTYSANVIRMLHECLILMRVTLKWLFLHFVTHSLTMS